MFCPQCGKDLPDGSPQCTACGHAMSATPVTERPESAMSYAAPQSTGPAGGGGTTPQPVQFDFQLARLGKGDRIAGVSALVLFISLFLPWYTYFGVSGNALDVHGWMYLDFILVLATMAYVALRGLSVKFKLPLPHWQALVALTGGCLLLAAVAFIDKPSFTSYGFGAFLGLIAGIGAVVGAVMRRNEPEDLTTA